MGVGVFSFPEQNVMQCGRWRCLTLKLLHAVHVHVHAHMHVVDVVLLVRC